MSGARYLAAATPLRLGSGGAAVAIPILSVEVLNDVALGGLLVAASLAPAVVAAPLVGAALDRTRHPRSLIAAAGAISALGFAGAALLGILPTAVVAVGLIAAGAAGPFFLGGLSSFVTDEIPAERRAYALDALSYNLGSVGGPALVAVTTAFGSARAAMAAMAVIALLGVAGLFLTTLRPRPSTGSSIWRTMGDGLRHIVRHRPLAVVTASGTLSQLGGGALPVAAVVLALDRTREANDGAVIVAAFAIGGLVGALATAARPGRLRPELSMGIGFTVIGLLLLGAARDGGLWWTVVLVGIAGLFTASSAAAMLLLRKQQSPASLRGQVFTVGAGLRATAAAAGAACAAATVGWGGTVQFLGIGAIWVLSGALLALYPRNTESIDG
ncbi:MFS transporter [Planctomonas psychrotolerans]|uniref:MFS transporter n=1 Tax=Planctomonas psychrotolerans TaxID=2528712 RepID=UPI001D0D217B|nr:MFS transporter [Planctomonas psychrotolerans]